MSYLELQFAAGHQKYGF